MKRMIALILCCIVLTGCSAAPADDTMPTFTKVEVTVPIQEAVETMAAEHYITLYAPNEDATGFIYASIEVSEISADAICNALIGADVLKEDVRFNSLVVENGQILLDVNDAFGRQLMSYGTAGEYMMVGSVVNTLLSAYGVETVYITMDGKTMESGHVIYDFPQEFYESQVAETVPPEVNSGRLALIEAVSTSVITFDEVEYVDIPSQQAEALGVTPENTPGTFFLHNETALAETFPISPDCVCTVFDWYGDYVQKTVTPAEFAALLAQRNAPNIPYYVTTENGMVTGIEELLVP